MYLIREIRALKFVLLKSGIIHLYVVPLGNFDYVLLNTFCNSVNKVCI